MDQQTLFHLRQAVEQRGTGEFHLPEIFKGWEDLPIDRKVRMGRDFLEAVRRGDLPGVEDTGRKEDGGRVYLWTRR